MKNQGFTLIELIVVMIVISILAVAVYPKINSTSDFAYVSQRDQLISLLRNVQQRAMQNTQNTDANNLLACHLVRFDNQLQQIGFSARNTNGSCSAGIEGVSGDVDDFLIVELDSAVTVINPANETVNAIGFNFLGQAFYDYETNLPIKSSFQIQLSPDHKVCIESEGYIHVCS